MSNLLFVLVWFFIHNIFLYTIYCIIKVIKGDVVNFKSFLLKIYEMPDSQSRLIK